MSILPTTLHCGLKLGAFAVVEVHSSLEQQLEGGTVPALHGNSGSSMVVVIPAVDLARRSDAMEQHADDRVIVRNLACQVQNRVPSRVFPLQQLRHRPTTDNLA